MPCNSDYLDASNLEVELSRTYCILDELYGNHAPIDNSHWNGYHPKAYNKANKPKLDREVARLCGMLSKLDGQSITQLSLEAQIWWRDHQLADKERKESERAESAKQSIVDRALSKLTGEERKALGL